MDVVHSDHVPAAAPAAALGWTGATDACCTRTHPELLGIDYSVEDSVHTRAGGGRG